LSFVLLPKGWNDEIDWRSSSHQTFQPHRVLISISTTSIQSGREYARHHGQFEFHQLKMRKNFMMTMLAIVCACVCV
jgi:hypothetical protein